MAEKIFNILKNENELVSLLLLDQTLEENGIKRDDPRIKSLVTNENIYLNNGGCNEVNLKEFKDIINCSFFFINKVFNKSLIVKDFNTLKQNILQLYNDTKKNDEGNIADYIPQLARVDDKKYGISICTISGQRNSIGDCNDYFCVQSTCKPINYLIALEDHGEDTIHKYVGKEPSGSRFNALMLNDEGKPHNPLINSGAIMTCSLLKNELNNIPGEKFERIINYWGEACGNIKKVNFNNPIYLSEKKTADRNFALAYFMRETNDQKKVGFPENTNIQDILELYFQCCSIEITCEMMSIIAATLANGGVCPLTNKRIWRSDCVKNCLSLMTSCGMYDYSGQFGFTMGFPAKSGVSGVIMIVIPGVMGVCTWSPKLDKYGNSVKGIDFCNRLSKLYNFHQYDIFTDCSKEKNKSPIINNNIENNNNIHTACYLASVGDLLQLRSLYLQDFDLNQSDYDGRTPLHLACSEGMENIVEFLIKICKCHNEPKDRWGNTPLDDAVREGHENIKSMLSQNIENKKKESVEEEMAEELTEYLENNIDSQFEL